MTATNKGAVELNNLRESAKAMVAAISELLKAVKVVGDEATRSLRAIDAAMAGIAASVAQLDSLEPAQGTWWLGRTLGEMKKSAHVTFGSPQGCGRNMRCVRRASRLGAAGRGGAQRQSSGGVGRAAGAVAVGLSGCRYSKRRPSADSGGGPAARCQRWALTRGRSDGRGHGWSSR